MTYISTPEKQKSSMHWPNEIALWCEMLLGGRADYRGVHQNFYDGCFAVKLCAALEARPSDGDIAALGTLIERSLAWDGPKGMLWMECTGRKSDKFLRHRIRFARETNEIYSFRLPNRLLWCVRVSTVNHFLSEASYPRRGEEPSYFVDLFMFPPVSVAHMELFIAVERQNERSGCTANLFLPLVSVLRWASSFVVPFEGEAVLKRVQDPSMWLELVRAVWPRAEQVEADAPLELSNDQNGALLSVLTRMGFFNSTDYPPCPPIVIAQGGDGVFITVSQHTAASGCVLLVAGVM